MPAGLSPNNKLGWTWPPPPPVHTHTRIHALTHTRLTLVLGCICRPWHGPSQPPMGGSSWLVSASTQHAGDLL